VRFLHGDTPRSVDPLGRLASLRARLAAVGSRTARLTAGGPALAAFFGNLAPVFAALMSAALLGEAPRAFHIIAFALIVAGIVVSTGRRPG